MNFLLFGQKREDNTYQQQSCGLMRLINDAYLPLFCRHDRGVDLSQITLTRIFFFKTRSGFETLLIVHFSFVYGLARTFPLFWSTSLLCASFASNLHCCIDIQWYYTWILLVECKTLADWLTPMKQARFNIWFWWLRDPFSTCSGDIMLGGLIPITLSLRAQRLCTLCLLGCAGGSSFVDWFINRRGGGACPESKSTNAWM